ncbi:hypothetical protein TEQG_03855 [Trichophyton equinum CBS 127.97]|uniref:Uncharacterized protein n=1 Tax=Trichophyton equinum (strain ATCC MYA-4606 / CBS 127.97) TaxID=559882 RepID=F2PSZ4_TRIEC|nr:hypothetical protein TEQG_03855 [Trichophyton equinum CBS 127.97]
MGIKTQILSVKTCSLIGGIWLLISRGLKSRGAVWPPGDFNIKKGFFLLSRPRHWMLYLYYYEHGISLDKKSLCCTSPDAEELSKNQQQDSLFSCTFPKIPTYFDQNGAEGSSATDEQLGLQRFEPVDGWRCALGSLYLSNEHLLGHYDAPPHRYGRSQFQLFDHLKAPSSNA